MMRYIAILYGLISILSGCATSQAKLPSDVSGELEPINQSQVINDE